jgi:uncharacterized protein YbjT (DUF2867 family)
LIPGSIGRIQHALVHVAEVPFGKEIVMYVVMGVSGNTGSVVARSLLDQKKPVRVVVRDAKKGEPWKKLGAEVAVADANDARALEQAFQNAVGAWALIPPDPSTNDYVGRGKTIADAISSAVKAAKVQHVVFLSSVGAQHESGTGPIKTLHVMETKLTGTGLNATFVRAAYFMENNLGMVGLMKSQGILPVFADPSYAFPMVATKDIGQVAAQALVEGGKGVQIIELSGPKEYSMNDVAAAFAKALDRPVKTVVNPLSGLVPAMTQMGTSQNMAEGYQEMYEGMGQGKVAFEGGRARPVRGRVDLETFAKNGVKAA